jgi:alkylation response protein AidB-like acyl-CoA dehydrogenase
VTYDREALERVINDVVAPRVAEVDGGSRFPREAIDALGAAGLLGHTMPSAQGGGGGAVVDAVDVVRRLAAVCGSTAMVVMMHYAGSVVLANHGDEEVQRSIAEGRHLTTRAFS